MRNLFGLLVALLALGLLAPVPIGAADGDLCDEVTTFRGGNCIMLLDGASSTGLGSGGVGIPLPDDYNGQALMFSASKTTGCTVGSLEVQVSWSETSAGDVLHHIVTLDGDPTSGNALAHYIQEGVRIPGFLFANALDITGPCTDLDVVVHIAPERRR